MLRQQQDIAPNPMAKLQPEAKNNRFSGGMGTKNACLARALELFPDISHAHVEELCDRADIADLRQHGLPYIDRVIDILLQNTSYPKQSGSKRKRPVGDADKDDEKWMGNPPFEATEDYLDQSVDLLMAEFPRVPVPYIRKLVTKRKTLYSSYQILYEYENFPAGPTPYAPLKRVRKSHGSYVREPHKRELNAAKKKAGRHSAELCRKRDHEEAEKRNLEEFARRQSLVECKCCYNDVPSNRVVSCGGVDVHSFCFACITMAAQTQIGLMQYEMKCFDTSGCQANLTRSQLKQGLRPSILEKLDSLQQQDEITKADIDGLEDCPFCDFRAICPPIDEDREFKCQNPDCEKISCRLCRDESHTPKSCEENRRMSGRHRVEEAMSKAVIRNCPKCSLPIIKDEGCNRMVCSKCRCAICYVCKQDISGEGYEHFRHRFNCPLHDDNVLARHQREINQAEQVTIKQIRAEHPGLTEYDLRVQTEAQRRVPVPGYPEWYQPPAPDPPGDNAPHLNQLQRPWVMLRNQELLQRAYYVGPLAIRPPPRGEWLLNPPPPYAAIIGDRYPPPAMGMEVAAVRNPVPAPQNDRGYAGLAAGNAQDAHAARLPLMRTLNPDVVPDDVIDPPVAHAAGGYVMMGLGPDLAEERPERDQNMPEVDQDEAFFNRYAHGGVGHQMLGVENRLAERRLGFDEQVNAPNEEPQDFQNQWLRPNMMHPPFPQVARAQPGFNAPNVAQDAELPAPRPLQNLGWHYHPGPVDQNAAQNGMPIPRFIPGQPPVYNMWWMGYQQQR